MESRWIRWRDRTVAVVAKRSQFAYAWGAASRTDGRQLEAIDAKFEFREDFEPWGPRFGTLGMRGRREIFWGTFSVLYTGSETAFREAKAVSHRLSAHYILPVAQRLDINKRISWHTFRHTYSTLHRSTGAELKIMQELLRYSTIRVTLDT